MAKNAQFQLSFQPIETSATLGPKGTIRVQVELSLYWAGHPEQEPEPDEYGTFNFLAPGNVFSSDNAEATMMDLCILLASAIIEEKIKAMNVLAASGLQYPTPDQMEEMVYDMTRAAQEDEKNVYVTYPRETPESDNSLTTQHAWPFSNDMGIKEIGNLKPRVIKRLLLKDVALNSHEATGTSHPKPRL